MTLSDFRDLLRDYLTQPEYARVTYLKDDDAGQLRMGVRLDDGTRFLVSVEKVAKGSPYPS